MYKNFNKGKKFLNLKYNLAFTIVELMVTASIVAVISAVILFNYSSLNSQIAVSSNTQEVALDIRQTQVYGLSVKESVIGGGDFGKGYGIYFTMSDPKNYYIFVDNDNNGKYDGTTSCISGSECIQKVAIRNGVSISSICGAVFGGSLVCPPSATVNAMHITFIRPNTEANIRFTTSLGSFYGGVFQTGRVNFSSADGRVGRVTVENTGQISVQ